MRAGWRPERRNRKIGTAAAGHGQDNRLVIPQSWHESRDFTERLGPHDTIEARLQGRRLTVLAEPARRGATYGCGPADVVHLLDRLPAADLAGLALVVFRQPTRKQETLRPAWGRCLFQADFGRHSGPAILLEAIELERPLVWPRRLCLAEREELERLAADGHEVTRDRRATTLRLREESVRGTVLYRTLLHEVGHWVDWQRRVLRPAGAPGSPPQGELEAAYFARPPVEREAVAHRYATEQAGRLRAAGVIPFAPRG